MKIFRILAGLVVVLALALGIALRLSLPDPLPVGTQSAARLAAGPYSVERTEFTWIDSTRPTDSNGDYAGASDRRLEVALWSPTDASGPRPLVVYSHGFMSTRDGGTHLAEHLASHGYVVVAASFPLTNFNAPGGPNATDVINQPQDVSFLIDRVLALGPEERTFLGGIDPGRIGVTGVSLGGLTATLAAYHPRFRDPRIRAAISIAGPSVMFEPRYFDFADVPFLMIAGTHDAMIRYEENAEPIPDKIIRGGLITLTGASHAGFSYLAEGPMRLLGNPDEIGCWSLISNLELEAGEDPFPDLGGPAEGILDASESTMPCEYRFETAMPAGKQHWLTVLAARAFFESHFATDPESRAQNALFLARTLPEELSEIHYTPASRSRVRAVPPSSSRHEIGITDRG